MKAEVIVPDLWLKPPICSVSPQRGSNPFALHKDGICAAPDTELGLVYSVLICHPRLPAGRWRRRMGAEKALGHPGVPHRGCF